MAILFHLPGMEKLSQSLLSQGDLTAGEFEMRSFPDGDSYLRVESSLETQSAVILCSLNDPDQKALRIMFLAETLRDLGVQQVGLLAPYLGYMRQDTRFKEGEAVTSKYFGKFISNYFDWLITVDPHLHRYKSLDEVYAIPTTNIHAATSIAKWVKTNVSKPLLIGPDMESEQWVSEVARKANAPYIILEKIRHGDRHVDISLPQVDKYQEYTPVLVDDIISTARTMIGTVLHLKELSMKAPICIGVHGIFAGEAYDELKRAGASKIITCNTIDHHSNSIDLSESLGAAIQQHLQPDQGESS